MKNPLISNIIDHLWQWTSTGKDREVIKDTTNINNVKFDCYVNSTPSDPLSFSIFELSEKGELMINDAAKIVESQAAFFLFVNTKSGWIVAVKNTLENQKKLIQGEKIQNLKIKMIP